MGMHTVVSIEQILHIIKKHIRLVSFVTLIITGLIWLLTVFLMTPQYQASAQVLVNRKQANAVVQTNQIQTDIQMINTYKDIIRNPIILDEVADKLKAKGDFSGNVKQLQQMITISNKENSQVFSVDVKAKNPYLASDIANQTVNTFKKKIGKIMSVNNISIISKAKPDKHVVSPSLKKNLLIGVMGGLILGVLLAILSEYLDKTVKDTQFIADELGLPNLGVVFEIPEATGRGTMGAQAGPKIADTKKQQRVRT